MQREIKFRAWEMPQEPYTNVEVASVGFAGKMWTVDHPKFWAHCMLNQKEYALMQYTGLKDKNEKEIYEGDILKWEKSGKDWIVFWNEGAYRMNATDDHDPIKLNENLFGGRTRYLEVIGNIYENPELLQK